jgi:hypothetical protein
VTSAVPVTNAPRGGDAGGGEEEHAATATARSAMWATVADFIRPHPFRWRGISEAECNPGRCGRTSLKGGICDFLDEVALDSLREGNKEKCT